MIAGQIGDGLVSLVTTTAQVRDFETEFGRGQILYNLLLAESELKAGRAEEALALVGLPTDPAAMTDGLGAAALKKLELARALATKPRLLLADESLGGLDATEMERAADLLETIRSRMGITIIWVEHIMGVLMRIVDRVIVLDHGEKIFEGKPKEAASDPRVTEVYLGKTHDKTHDTKHDKAQA